MEQDSELVYSTPSERNTYYHRGSFNEDVLTCPTPSSIESSFHQEPSSSKPGDGATWVPGSGRGLLSQMKRESTGVVSFRRGGTKPLYTSSQTKRDQLPPIGTKAQPQVRSLSDHPESMQFNRAVCPKSNIQHVLFQEPACHSIGINTPHCPKGSTQNDLLQEPAQISQKCARGNTRPVLFQEHANTSFQEPRYVLQSPRLPTFSGDARTEVSYRQWRAEVKSLETDTTLPNHTLIMMIRRSLRGMASDYLLQLGTDLNVSEIIMHLDTVFGDVWSSEQILEKFYAAGQKKDENVASWGCRLRELLSRCPDSKFSTGSVFQSMLRQKFWSGLYYSRIKEATRHRLDGGATFEELLVACRTIEQESNKPEKDTGTQGKAQSNMLTEKKQDDVLEQILKKIQDLETKVVSLERQKARRQDEVESSYRLRKERLKSDGMDSKVTESKSEVTDFKKRNVSHSKSWKSGCWTCGEMNHIRRNCPQRLNDNNPTKRGTRGMKDESPTQ